MHSFSIYAVIAAAAAATAENVLTFKSVDNVDRTVIFTPSINHAEHPDVKVSGGQSVDVTMPEGWVGNAYAIHEGKERTPGMLAEFTFNGWKELSYYDVSNIVTTTDVDNVATIEDVNGGGKISGCANTPHFPCDNVYKLPDDLQTKGTKGTHFLVTLSMNNGGSASKKRDANRAARRSYQFGQEQ